MPERSRRIEVFFYGLFMDSDALHAKGLQPINIRLASLQDYALLIGGRATLVRKSGHRVYGVLVELTHDEIDRLYSDASVSAYRPEPVIVEPSKGQPVAALCFNLVSFPETTETDPEYAARLRDLGRRLGLPAEYVESIGVS